MTGGVGKYPGAMFHPAAFGVVRAIDDFADFGEGRGLGAHGAGLERYKKCAVFQILAVSCRHRCAQGEQFGMGGGVVVGFDKVVGLGQHGPIPRHDGGGDRHLATFSGGAGEGDEGGHILGVCIARVVGGG